MLIKLYIILVLSSCGITEQKGENKFPKMDGCDFYKFQINGLESENDYDTIRNFVQSMTYKSKELETVLLFDKYISNKPIVYVHSQLDKKGNWDSNIICNEYNLSESELKLVREVSKELTLKLIKFASFEEIYFSVLIFDP